MLVLTRAAYDKTQMLLEIGNERMPGHSAACVGNDCIAAFFGFALKAQARADELKLGKLPLVLAIWAWVSRVAAVVVAFTLSDPARLSRGMHGLGLPVVSADKWS